MADRMNKSHFALACCLAASLLCSNGLGAATNNVFTAYSRAEVATSPSRTEDLSWLIGSWVCVDRALRSPPTRMSEAYYAFLSSLHIEDEAIELMGPRAAFSLTIGCEYMRYFDGTSIQPMRRYSVYASEGLLIGAPYGDLFTIRREPVKFPTWFLLEHTVSKDILLFRRLVTEKGRSDDR